MSYGEVREPRAVGTPSVEQSRNSLGQTDPEGTPRSPQGTKVAKRRSLVGTVIETLLIVGAAFAIAMLMQTFMFRITGILQESMLPTVDPGDRIIVNCLTYHFREPKPGEIVVIHDPTDDKKDIIKRVIALGGDTIEVADGVLYVNGAVVDETYVVNKDVVKGQARFTIPEGYVYVMGDNRPRSGDSRGFGPVAEDQIVGKVICVMWPIDHWKTF
jgi:signal peptidase I